MCYIRHEVWLSNFSLAEYERLEIMHLRFSSGLHFSRGSDFCVSKISKITNILNLTQMVCGCVKGGCVITWRMCLSWSQFVFSNIFTFGPRIFYLTKQAPCQTFMEQLLWFKHIGLLTKKWKSKISGTFLDSFFKMATDIIFHRFWVDLDSILGCLLVLKPEKMDTKKHNTNMPAKKSRRNPRPHREIRE